ncbi:aldehyde dehydrogenase family protein [Arthrobacter psychrolactophilus]|uniref:Aldehyde dehydrogenase n=1 Tax=Arthrobacter psychrolactophilus TaxID=92442 RepID=A0A2V5INL1_9MICC|nr:aldehyde dehydrogenase family protein [Arthrobacter psychrolactophilus]PYI38178.1 aldehyde dehydrogenase family protein [Arthrobacter psychrolactophilus]
MNVQEAVTAARTVFNSGVTKPLDWRLQQLKAMNAMLVEHREDFTQALAADLGKHPSEAWLTEIGFLTAEIAHTIKQLPVWLKPQKVAVPLALQPARAATRLEPLGVVLVIAPWNYPVQLLLAPMIGALAAGNTVVGKPSEMAPASSALLARLVPNYLADAVTIVEGGIPETTELLEQRFDHIFYTGNGKVARIVMSAAAKHLTPLTLELGGKSPVYIDESVEMITAARRIVWGKFMNAGQTCVAPDYVLGTDAALAKLAKELPLAIEELYGTDAAHSLAYGRIINDAAFTRLTGLLEQDLQDDAGSALVSGGTTDAATRYIEPTVIHVDAHAALMQDEIFGPILPLVTVASAQEAIDFINERDKPLALYVFSDDEGVRKDFTEGTTSGALTFGVPVAHLSVPGLPFGGVGQSGMGRYHGQDSIATFSHRKAILDKPLSPDTLALIYPPFGSVKKQLIKRFVAPAKKFRKS